MALDIMVPLFMWYIIACLHQIIRAFHVRQLETDHDRNVYTKEIGRCHIVGFFFFLEHLTYQCIIVNVLCERILHYSI